MIAEVTAAGCFPLRNEFRELYDSRQLDYDDCLNEIAELVLVCEGSLSLQQKWEISIMYLGALVGLEEWPANAEPIILGLQDLKLLAAQRVWWLHISFLLNSSIHQERCKAGRTPGNAGFAVECMHCHLAKMRRLDCPPGVPTLDRLALSPEKCNPGWHASATESLRMLQEYKQFTTSICEFAEKLYPYLSFAELWMIV